MEKVLLAQDIPAKAKEYLTGKGYDVTIAPEDNEQFIVTIIHDYDAVLTRTAHINHQVIQAASKLKVIAKHGVGLDCIDLEAASAQDIKVAYTPEANNNTVAEHTLMLMLALAKNILVADRETRDGNYLIRKSLGTVDLEGRTLGIIGLGRIGRGLAQKAVQGFGMNVIGYDPFLTEAPKDVAKMASWEEVFQSADFVSVHFPLTPETKNSISLNEFKLMKRTAFFINASRGETVVEKDLIRALEQGLIKGAGIDVFAMEPPEKDNKLFDLNNVIVTPHCASLTEEGKDRMAMHAVMEIDRVLSGQEPKWLVR